MMSNPNIVRYLGCLLLYALLTPLYAQQAGETVRLQGEIREDVYAAGGTVDVLASVDGDLVVAGGRVSVSERVGGDVMAVGGTLNLQAVIRDDVRLAGGDVRIGGSIGDDAIAAAGNLTLMPDARVNGRAWLSGGRLELAGSIGKELKAAGGRIVLSGRVDGDVELRGGDIRILDSAVIDGNLVYHSPHEAQIADRAQIRGSVDYRPEERPVAGIVAAFIGVYLLLLLSLMVTGAAVFLLFPRFIGAAGHTARAEPWKSLGLGLAVFAATPVVISLLFMSVIGWLPALIIGALYLLLLLIGLLTGIFRIGELGLAWRGRREPSKGARVGAFALALTLILLLGLVPVLGTLLLLLIMLSGAGALTLELYRIYPDRTAG